MKNKIFIIGFVFVLLSSFVLGALGNNLPFETEFISEGKFSYSGTVGTSYDEGKFNIDKGVHTIFAISVDTVQTITFRSGLLDDYGNLYYCIGNDETSAITISSVNGTFYGHCDIDDEINATGQYYYFISTTGYDENFYLLEKVEIINATFPIYDLILIILGVVLVIGSLFFREGIIMLIGFILLTSVSIDLSVVYFYAMGTLGVLIPSVFIILSLIIFAKIIQESF